MTHTNARTLRNALTAALEGTASDETRPVLETVHVTIGSSQAVFTGMDGWIVIQARIPINDGPATPISAMLQRGDVIGTIKRLRSYGNTDVPLDIGVTTWSCGEQIMALADFAKRPDQRDVFKMSLASGQPPFKLVDPKLMQRALKYAPSAVRIELHDMTLLVSGEEYRAVVMGMTGGKNRTFAFTHLEAN